jgi:hypothetical protein
MFSKYGKAVSKSSLTRSYRGIGAKNNVLQQFLDMQPKKSPLPLRPPTAPPPRSSTPPPRRSPTRQITPPFKDPSSRHRPRFLRPQ